MTMTNLFVLSIAIAISGWLIGTVAFWLVGAAVTKRLGAVLARRKLRRALLRTRLCELVEQHETLIRLARRCAYDFRHAIDGIPQDHWFRTELAMHERPAQWIAIFNAGNPGKDYRTALGAENALLHGRIACYRNELRAHCIPDPFPPEVPLPF